MSIIKVDDIQSTTAGAVGFSTLPAFHVYTSETITLTTSYAAVLAGKKGGTLLNQGSHFNNTTGKFTAPIAGVYNFGFACIGAAGATVYRFRYYKNGSDFFNIEARFDNTNGGGSSYIDNAEHSVTLALAASDTIELYGKSDDGTDLHTHSDSYRYVSFRGHLLG